jgi:hypothetical protein
MVEGVLLVLVMLLVLALPVAVAIAPAILMVSLRRAPASALLLYLASLALVAAFVVAGNENLEWADRTGGAGNIFAGIQWLIAATLTATASSWWTLRPRRATNGRIVG